jgi:hypothetical protein
MCANNRFCLHVRNFDLIESIDDHSAAVTSVKIVCNGSKILSCSADRYALQVRFSYDYGSFGAIN